jgi:hypothetical protein
LRLSSILFLNTSNNASSTEAAALGD